MSRRKLLPSWKHLARDLSNLEFYKLQDHKSRNRLGQEPAEKQIIIYIRQNGSSMGKKSDQCTITTPLFTQFYTQIAFPHLFSAQCLISGDRQPPPVVVVSEEQLLRTPPGESSLIYIHTYIQTAAARQSSAPAGL
ncbi:hypothetical protein VOLCADRAFT_97739 [Volvox carteri f. nagariensis]|uniref:Uncharacterized protein n=1 Tax=Volvox carteri f. nagariensis TaxID=3068 RepID=D8UDI5_VOLCA|nr:uncharacterized protein VOLCADRAFT_97739 [Volvox carteri f. nagariensis]EFJ42196.1 hypothetical protein VOLCADRAFT_97739 [Volvox carteri f. nagariensis]|eukprot:XP_002956739.1 hypothetical protein VOLCADRAFT_97739 [Volvox carteri f. nagariensis]